jgi:ribonuclease HII
VVSRCARGIDSRGLHRTNLAALRDALAAVAQPDCLCLVDGFRLGDIGYDQRAIVDGDAQSAAIAAASIVAKVSRDEFMHRADRRHPGWDFAAHVGYSTPEHRDAIERIGVSPLHRLSFQSVAYQQLALRSTSEGVLDVVEADELAVGVDDHGDQVEAHDLRPRSVVDLL